MSIRIVSKRATDGGRPRSHGRTSPVASGEVLLYEEERLHRLGACRGILQDEVPVEELLGQRLLDQLVVTEVLALGVEGGTREGGRISSALDNPDATDAGTELAEEPYLLNGS
jgi:hypothetical protein